MCTLCGAERAANWFAAARGNLSGRRSYCRLGRNGNTDLCWHAFALPRITANLAHPLLTHSMLHTPLMQRPHVHPAPACFDISSAAGNLPAGHVHLSTGGSVGQPYARFHQPCQVKRSAASVTKYAQRQAFTRLFLDMFALPLHDE